MSRATDSDPKPMIADAPESLACDQSPMLTSLPDTMASRDGHMPCWDASSVAAFMRPCMFGESAHHERIWMWVRTFLEANLESVKEGC